VWLVGFLEVLVGNSMWKATEPCGKSMLKIQMLNKMSAKRTRYHIMHLKEGFCKPYELEKSNKF